MLTFSNKHTLALRAQAPVFVRIKG